MRCPKSIFAIVDENNNTRVFYDPIYILDGKKISKDKFKTSMPTK